MDWIEKQTNIHTNYPRMLSGAVQGRLLTMLVEISRATRILEIGAFTGYSATCMAYGLPEYGHIDALEINDELEDLMREGWSRAGVADKITLHIGDARDIIPQVGGKFDLVFMDANKRQYLEYYNLVFDYVNPDGFILADNTLWDGKVVDYGKKLDAQTAGILEFNDFVAADERVEKVIIPLRDGLTIIHKLPL